MCIRDSLAAGKPVVSTSIPDVVRTYGRGDLVRIADSVAEFIAACERALIEPPGPRRAKADQFLRNTSWDRTWKTSATLLEDVLGARQPSRVMRTATADVSVGD